MSELAIECVGLRKSFTSAAEDLEILKGVDLSLPFGASVSITGPSGCGKSTLLSILGGLERPSSGEASVCGVELSTAGKDGLADFRARTVGFVFQFHYLLKDFTALENVMLPSFMLDGRRAEAERKALPLLEAVGLSERLGHLPSKLSGGERQRVAIARALVNGPRVVLADEPTGNLDRAASGAVERLLFEVAAERGATLVLVTHDEALAARAETRFTLSDGVLVRA